jgi:hypothetical protein
VDPFEDGGDLQYREAGRAGHVRHVGARLSASSSANQQRLQWAQLCAAGVTRLGDFCRLTVTLGQVAARLRLANQASAIGGSRLV